MTHPEDISWGKYGSFEGPFYWGKHPFELPDNPTDNQKLVAVTSATEGQLDSCNMYDGQILSITMIQVTERLYFTASQALGFALERHPHLMEQLQPALEASNATFKRGPRGWRFYQGSHEVNTVTKQEQLMLRCDGKKGSWGSKDSPQRRHAKTWAAAVASFWSQPEAQEAQIDFVSPRIKAYAFHGSAKVIREAEALGTDIAKAFVAAYLTFAVNNPTRANQYLGKAQASWRNSMWSLDWLTHVLRTLTFGPRISIYPHRYNAIRKPLERLYRIDLPDMAGDLMEWQSEMRLSHETPERILDENLAANNDHPTFTTVKEIQALLLALGYDLGVRGVDGNMGRKTKAALLLFQEDQGLVVDGDVGPKTRSKMVTAWANLGL